MSSPSPPRLFPTTGFTTIDDSYLLVEEIWEWYEPGLFYPEHRYGVTIKVCEQSSEPVHRELAAFRHFEGTKTSNPGRLFIRTALDTFTIRQESNGAEHQYFVHKPLGISMAQFVRFTPGRGLPELFLKGFTYHVLHALNFLHTESRNIHLDLENDFDLKDFEESEINDPSPRKFDGDRTIYCTRPIKLPKKAGRPILCDFGEARFGQSTYTDIIQPYQYRASEVILGIPWSYSMDIWNVGVLMWHIFEGKQMFTAKNPQSEDEDSSLHRLAQMVSLIGNPPVEFLRRSVTKTPRSIKRSDDVPISTEMSLEASEEHLEGEKKIDFLRFLRKMIQWEPEKRSTGNELLEDPWIH
ncbi:kinase-like domain-containing protein [Cyathus striatus]|nr:kinase-like domain-containing protein [Cyathus striatus]